MGGTKGHYNEPYFMDLMKNIKDELAARDECEDLENLISLIIRLDNRLRERRREKLSCSSNSPMVVSVSPSMSNLK